MASNIPVERRCDADEAADSSGGGEGEYDDQVVTVECLQDYLPVSVTVRW